MKEKKHTFKSLGKELWIYSKYQLISKSIIGIIGIPVFKFIIDFLIKTSGRTNISSGDYINFIFSINGLGVMGIGILFLTFITGMDINVFIIISSLIKEKRYKIKIKNIIITAFKSLKYFFSPVGFFLIAVIALILPLFEIGFNISPLKNFKIPNFITSVIFTNPIYSIAYSIVLLILLILSVIYIFTVHFMLFNNKKGFKAFKNSRLLLKKHWKEFIKDYILKLIKSMFILFFTLLLVFILVLLYSFISQLYTSQNVLILKIIFTFYELSAVFIFLSVPIAISLLTNLFYKYNEKDGNSVKLEFYQKQEYLHDNDLNPKIKFKTKIEITVVLMLFMGANLLLAIVVENNFNIFFKTETNIDIIAHRGGGDLGAENSLEGIQKAIKENIQWTEIDVQRTKDGKYIINHDKTFARLTGVKKKPMQMTLPEIKKLKVKNEFNPNALPATIPTLEELLDITKGKIGVFVELKGKSADYRMVDDVVQMIKQKNMLDECVILSLDYKIIEYTEKLYPEIKTGFLYFFSVGKLKNLKGDYLIMEEREATANKILEIHKAEKKAIVWTVNTAESINRFINSDADGIITDHVLDVKHAIAKSKERNHLDIIIDNLIYR